MRRCFDFVRFGSLCASSTLSHSDMLLKPSANVCLVSGKLVYAVVRYVCVGERVACVYVVVRYVCVGERVACVCVCCIDD